MHDKENSDGKAYNVLTADLSRLNKFTSVVSGVVLVPWQQAVGAWYMYRLLGLAGILGTVLLTFSMALMRILIVKARRIEVRLGKLNDQRLALISEVVRGIGSVKLFGWGTRFMNIIGDKRQEQLTLLWRRAQMWSLISLCTLGSLPLVMFVTFIAYSFGHTMTAETVFTAISVFKLLQTSIDWIPGLAADCLSFFVSFRRIEAYLEGQEMQPLEERLGTGNREMELGFDNATLSWSCGVRANETADSGLFKLCNLRVQFPDGGLTLIGGPTGSGKSSLLAALAGEMYLESGRVLVPVSPTTGNQGIGMSSSVVLGNIAYVAQEPWLRNATIRDNILFGERYHRQRYERVVHMCALTADLATLEAGDMTEIGERGITLSGGQRQRVALARAIYSSRKILLIDDCLSAVDAQTGQHILHMCLRSKNEIMCGRTCLLVTHHMAMCLQHSEYVVLMENGQIVFQGTAEEVLSSTLVPLSKENNESVQHNKIMEDVALANATRESGRLVDEEERRRGAVGLKTWQEYFRPCGGWKFGGVCLASAIMMQLLTMGKDYYLAEKVGGDTGSAMQWLVVYLGLGTASAAGSALMLLGAYSAGLRTSASLHGRLLEAMVCATPRFLDTTPMGRILVRFSSDMQVVDEDIIEILMHCIRSVVVVSATLAVVAWTVPPFAAVGVAVAGAYVWLMWKFVQVQREGRRLQAIGLAPIASLHTEMLAGGDTIRAFGMQVAFAHEAARRASDFLRVDYMLRATSRWRGMHIGMVSSMAASATSAFVVAHAHRLGAGLCGFVLVYVGTFWAEAVTAVRQYSNLELSLGCVERLHQYLEVACEAPSRTAADNVLATEWPVTGKLEICGLVAGYINSVPVLHGLSFAVAHGEKIGVVGRTGAGKSTLAQTLMRLIEASSGKIILDGVNVAEIGLERLRQAITIIPQDPVLFNGTVRFNLDPFGDHSDELLFDALRRTLLLQDQSTGRGSGVAAFTSLDDVIMGSGHGLSLGQRQLVALARALVRRSRVVIMDEATASVDFATDECMQRAIRGAELANSTLLCIAHRLRTIIDYDRILVLDKGKVVEFDTPKNLLCVANGHFRYLCESSNEFALLQSLAT
ncbi:P-loop containing nucleoside triphosphate hydrolase protein [Coemansia reversa NRRL 1564]|uniref:P-loop containing nucleoside triphosphate hydrolase protein n=1 Tax=Coemansia reversa (strain ATCC 12441 / NRRL 1564) TaxID=763665 RepID=A0A2G5B2A1_COERN|nr:P-loop containing nucleoside triphosphate hydrolase protein [Coemansia reversa NRRL 1564]|eukprot:PIA13121.1 P-loop containing nucleoside triphosphate hydrolase protein [Coemansia reversa NRRL 1564]